jgi:uncharacterized protein (TIGR02996 family)
MTIAELWAAVRAAPDDDRPLLVLADVLLERGDPQGELIHLQCRIADGTVSRELREREREVLAEVRRRVWPGPGLPWFERGLLREILFRGLGDYFDAWPRLGSLPLAPRAVFPDLKGTTQFAADGRRVLQVSQRDGEYLHAEVWDVPSRTRLLYVNRYPVEGDAVIPVRAHFATDEAALVLVYGGGREELVPLTGA